MVEESLLLSTNFEEHGLTAEDHEAGLIDTTTACSR
jgi:hypothetical protein